MYTISEDMTTDQIKGYKILNEIERLEKENDQYMATFGRMNQHIYDRIQFLYDQYDNIDTVKIVV